MAAAVAWVAAFAAERGLRYEPEVDERWLRVWEPFATLKTPHRYEHSLESTGTIGSMTIARMAIEVPTTTGSIAGAASSWIAIAQDVRIEALAAATSDRGSPFAEPRDLVTVPPQRTGDAPFDHAFASFAATPDDAARAITPSVRKLVLSWQIPLHFELRKGGFILAPVGLAADPPGLAWFTRAIAFFGEKAARGAK